jgi:hypothetical protein
MRKQAILILMMLAFAVATSIAPAFGARPIQGSVGNVTAADGAALGPVGCRSYSALPGGETNVNDNIASCRNIRCGPKNYITNATLDPGGYICGQDATQVYNGDLPDQPYYELVDGNMNDATGDHIAFFGVAGVCGNNSGVGNFLAADCLRRRILRANRRMTTPLLPLRAPARPRRTTSHDPPSTASIPSRTNVPSPGVTVPACKRQHARLPGTTPSGRSFAPKFHRRLQRSTGNDRAGRRSAR